MRTVLARAVLLVAGVAAASSVSAQADPSYDFEAAGGAIAAVEMHEGAVGGIAGFCMEQLPSSARDWRKALEGWRERHAPWRVATERVRTEAYAKLRAQGEDPSVVEGLLAPVIEEYVSRNVGEVTSLADKAGASTVCATALELVSAGQFDVDENEYTKAIDLLRSRPPKNSQ